MIILPSACSGMSVQMPWPRQHGFVTVRRRPSPRDIALSSTAMAHHHLMMGFNHQNLWMVAVATRSDETGAITGRAVFVLACRCVPLSADYSTDRQAQGFLAAARDASRASRIFCSRSSPLIPGIRSWCSVLPTPRTYAMPLAASATAGIFDRTPEARLDAYGPKWRCWLGAVVPTRIAMPASMTGPRMHAAIERHASAVTFRGPRCHRRRRA